MTEKLADQIRRYVNEAYIAPARKLGRTETVVVAGDVHKNMRLENRMPAICAALDAQKFQDQFKVVLSRRTGPKQGSTATWCFSIER